MNEAERATYALEDRLATLRWSLEVVAIGTRISKVDFVQGRSTRKACSLPRYEAIAYVSVVRYWKHLGGDIELTNINRWPNEGSRCERGMAGHQVGHLKAWQFQNTRRVFSTKLFAITTFPSWWRYSTVFY
jgi:hypothetical protein